LRIVVSLIILAGLVLSGGCRANPVEASIPVEITSSQIAESLSTSVPSSPTQGDIQMTPSLPTPADPAASQLVNQARNDLAHKLGISAEQITVSSAEAVTWSDSSLGCPQPGMAYTQVLTSGYLILLEAAGKTYEYHTNRDTYVIFCENPRPPVPGMPGDT
jgi:hypothetical protein